MAEFQVLHEVGEMNLQQPNVKLSEQDNQRLANDNKYADHSEKEEKK